MVVNFRLIVIFGVRFKDRDKVKAKDKMCSQHVYYRVFQKRHIFYDNMILQTYVTESCSF